MSFCVSQVCVPLKFDTKKESPILCILSSSTLQSKPSYQPNRQKIHANVVLGCGADVWSASRSVTLRPDWEQVKVRVMYNGNKAKFEQNEDLR